MTQCSVLLSQIESELRGICDDVLDVLKNHLIPAATMAEAKVFYSKMCVTSFTSLVYYFILLLL